MTTQTTHPHRRVTDRPDAEDRITAALGVLRGIPRHDDTGRHQEPPACHRTHLDCLADLLERILTAVDRDELREFAPTARRRR